MLNFLLGYVLIGFKPVPGNIFHIALGLFGRLAIQKFFAVLRHLFRCANRISEFNFRYALFQLSIYPFIEGFHAFARQSFNVLQIKSPEFTWSVRQQLCLNVITRTPNILWGFALLSVSGLRLALGSSRFTREYASISFAEGAMS
jgi:hypothetical protein